MTDVAARPFARRGAPPPAADCLIVDGCDFERHPAGGQLATARQMMAAFGSRVALVGVTTDATPVGRWVRRQLGADEFWYFAVGRRRPLSARRPWVPARVTFGLELAQHSRRVLSLGVSAAFVMAPEALFVAASWKLRSLCYCFPGVSNPLSISRYTWARPLARAFDAKLFKSLQAADVVFASADSRAIDTLIARSRGRLARERVRVLPTTYDAAVFRETCATAARDRLQVPRDIAVLVCSGRINRAKGWDLLVRALSVIVRARPQTMLVFVGDGEDRVALLELGETLGVSDRIMITGFLSPPCVAEWLNAAHTVVVGSLTEGWSVAMMEALACGKPLVSTDVSGARNMICEGRNGFVVSSRDPGEFADAVLRALELPDARSASVAIAGRYAPSEFARRIGDEWEPLGARVSSAR